MLAGDHAGGGMRGGAIGPDAGCSTVSPGRDASSGSGASIDCGRAGWRSAVAAIFWKIGAATTPP